MFLIKWETGAQGQKRGVSPKTNQKKQRFAWKQFKSSLVNEGSDKRMKKVKVKAGQNLHKSLTSP